MRKSFLVLVAAAVAALVPVTSAVASPQTYQRFQAKVIGKAGTNSKPRSVGVFLRPYHVVGDKGGPENTGNLNSGALTETPFATVYANVWLPKQLTIRTASFPRCRNAVVLASPNSCPKGSEIGRGVAAGYARNKEIPVGTGRGQYLLAPKLTVRVFVAAGGSNRVALRVLNPTTGNSIIAGVLSKATGSAARKFGSRLRFTIPKGLIEPLPNIVSQLSDFGSTLKAQSYKGKPLATLKACPKSRKLAFGYNGEYNINLDKSLSPLSAWGYSRNLIGKVINTRVACR